jgi:hypothetical protein
MKKQFSFMPIFLSVCICTVSFGCSVSLLKNLAGNNNVNSVKLAAKCQTVEALNEVKAGLGHQSQSVLAGTYLLQTLYYQELGETDSAVALYPKIIECASWIKNEQDADNELKAMKKDLCKQRKRQNFNCDCK